MSVRWYRNVAFIVLMVCVLAPKALRADGYAFCAQYNQGGTCDVWYSGFEADLYEIEVCETVYPDFCSDLPGACWDHCLEINSAPMTLSCVGPNDGCYALCECWPMD
jgi:hypothetical protein